MGQRPMATTLARIGALFLVTYVAGYQDVGTDLAVFVVLDCGGYR
jgi:hypothetical protein